jgi:hypothetical protein
MLAWICVDDAERRLRLLAPPAAFAAALLVYVTPVAGLARTFLSMWLHELGHAVTGWLCGFAALPGPWKTQIPDERSLAFSVMIFAALAAGGAFAWRARRRRLAAATAVAAALQLGFTLLVRRSSAHALVIFMGDGGGLVLGALLSTTFYLTRNPVRFGLLVIGAFGFMDPFVQWWRARRDIDAIPFGEIDGVGDSDPTLLTEEYAWSLKAMVTRYVALGVVCLLVVAAVWITSCRRGGSSPRSPS